MGWRRRYVDRRSKFSQTIGKFGLVIRAVRAAYDFGRSPNRTLKSVLQKSTPFSFSPEKRPLAVVEGVRKRIPLISVH